MMNRSTFLRALPFVPGVLAVALAIVLILVAWALVAAEVYPECREDGGSVLLCVWMLG